MEDIINVSWYHPLFNVVARLIDINIFGLVIINLLYYTMPNIYQRFDKAFGFYILLLWYLLKHNIYPVVAQLLVNGYFV